MITPPTPEEIAEIETAIQIANSKERRVLYALIEGYGDDVDTVLNVLHAMAARIAIATGVTLENFKAGSNRNWKAWADKIEPPVEKPIDREAIKAGFTRAFLKSLAD